MFFFFFFNDTATTEIYTLSLHDALPISAPPRPPGPPGPVPRRRSPRRRGPARDRKSTRLNSSHGYISYAVFCLKKKKKHQDATSYQPTHTPPCPRLCTTETNLAIYHPRS